MIVIPSAAFDSLCTVPVAYEDSAQGHPLSVHTKASVLLGWDDSAVGDNRSGEAWSVVVNKAAFPGGYRVRIGAVVVPDPACPLAATLPTRLTVQRAVLVGHYWHLACSARERPLRNG